MSAVRQRLAEVSKKADKKVSIDESELPADRMFVVPNFTNKQLLDAIPAHCFERSALRSSVTLVTDLAIIGTLMYGAYHIEDALSYLNVSELATKVLRVALWTAYCLVCSFWGTGLWVVGHECGHQSFSTSKTLNNTLGLIVHSSLLVPYHAWRISHGRHHAATGSLTRDEVFVPRTRKERKLPEARDEDEIAGINVSEESQSLLAEVLDHVPAIMWWTAIYQIAGFPLYLIMNAAGPNHYPKWTNHFMPSQVLFRKNHKWQIIISDIGLLVVMAGLTYWSIVRSFKEMMLIYGIPYLLVNSWIVMITYLQHTDPTVPHYSDNLWTFPRGALCTIDRTFLGPIGAWAVHGLCETHVLHHVCSKIPHYHAWEATEALKAFIGQHYHRSEENMLVSLWKSHRHCLFVEDGADIAFYKNARGQAQRWGVEQPPADSGVELSS